MPEPILVLAPDGSDARAIRDILDMPDMHCAFPDAAGLLTRIAEATLGLVILTEDAIGQVDDRALSEALAAQPPWSDCPFILISPACEKSVELIERLGNAVIVERPVRPEVLRVAVRGMLRTRMRQRDAHARLLECEATGERFRELAAIQEAWVTGRTAELTCATDAWEKAEKRLRESEELYRLTLELSQQIPWMCDSQGRLLNIGARWRELTGASSEAALGYGWRHFIHPEDASTVRQACFDIRASSRPIDVEYRLRGNAGAYRWYRSRAAPRTDEYGQVFRWYGTIEEIEEQKQALDRLDQIQAEMIHISRLSAMGSMASTLAHELNQPLTAITNYVRGSRRLLGCEGADKGLVAEALREADENAVRAGQLVRRLRELVARGDVQRQAENLPKLVRDACRIGLVDAPSLGIDCQLDLDPNASSVRVDRIQIQQVLINLIRNAVEAVQVAANRRIIITTSVISDDLCEIAVHDTGPGIAPGAAKTLFSAFSSTKKEGLGIGLSISRTIVEAHGGQIGGQNAQDVGATFRFTLPRG